MIAYFIHDDGSLFSCIICYLANWVGECTCDDICADLLSRSERESSDSTCRFEERDTTSGDDTLIDGCLSSIECIFDAEFFLFHLYLARGTDLDDGDTSGELRDALSDFLLIIVRLHHGYLVLELFHTTSDEVFFTTATDDCRRFFRRDDCFRMAEVLDACIFELVPELIRYECRTGEDSEVFEHFFFTVAKTRSLNPENSEDSFEFIQDDTSERLSIDIIGDDDELTATRPCE